MDTLSLSVVSVTIAALMLSVVFTAGVVWRVEMRLDTAFKSFFAGIVCLLLAEIADIWYVPETRAAAAFAADALRSAFALLFLAGILSMRRIVRDMDGERRNRTKSH